MPNDPTLKAAGFQNREEVAKLAAKFSGQKPEPVKTAPIPPAPTPTEKTAKVKTKPEQVKTESLHKKPKREGRGKSPFGVMRVIHPECVSKYSRQEPKKDMQRINELLIDLSKLIEAKYPENKHHVIAGYFIRIIRDYFSYNKDLDLLENKVADYIKELPTVTNIEAYGNKIMKEAGVIK